MKFLIHDNDLAYKIIDIFKYIAKKKIKIDLEEYIYCSGVDNYLGAKVYKKACFNKKGCKDFILVPDENAKDECKPLLQIQSIYYVLEDKEDIAYYPQILVAQGGYKIFIEYNIAHKDFVFTDTEPEP